jgi:hypothetical protein
MGNSAEHRPGMCFSPREQGTSRKSDCVRVLDVDADLAFECPTAHRS